MVLSIIICLIFFTHFGYSSESECQFSFSSLKSQEPSKLSQMIYYSGRDINDFGDQYACEKLGSTRFIVLVLDIGQIRIGIGICGPQVCQAKDYEEKIDWAADNIISKYPAASHVISADSYRVVDVKEYGNRKLDNAAWASLLVVVGILLLVVLGTLFEKNNAGEETKGWKSVLMCFSLTANISKIFTYPTNTDNFQVFNGLRVVSMLFICYSHNYVLSLPAPIRNPARVNSMLKEFWTHLDIFPIYMVDVFFAMSAFLLTYFLFPQLQKNKGKLNWPMFIIHRLLRICPIYFILLMIFVNLYSYLGSGPMWPLQQMTNENSCKYWWSNLLFISNFIPSDDYACMGWSWFIANDMQFHIFAPILLIIHQKSKIFGYSLIIFLILASFTFSFVQSIVNDYNPGILFGTSNKSQFLNNYQKPYTRIGPYLIAMIFALAYREYRNHKEKGAVNEFELNNVQEYHQLGSEEKPKMMKFEFFIVGWIDNWWCRIAAYCVGWIVMLSVPFMTYNFDNNGTEYWSSESKALYIASEHQLFAFGFLIWLLPIVEGHGGGFKSFLCSKYFAIFAKISFSFYLIHPMVINFYAFNRPESQYLSHFNTIYIWPAVVFYSFCLALLATICIESPILAIEKIIFSKSKH